MRSSITLPITSVLLSVLSVSERRKADEQSGGTGAQTHWKNLMFEGNSFLAVCLYFLKKLFIKGGLESSHVTAPPLISCFPLLSLLNTTLL